MCQISPKFDLGTISHTFRTRLDEDQEKMGTLKRKNSLNFIPKVETERGETFLAQTRYFARFWRNVFINKRDASFVFDASETSRLYQKT